MSRPPLPPFDEKSAIEKVRLAEDGWNTRDAAKVALAYSLDTRWRSEPMPAVVVVFVGVSYRDAAARVRKAWISSRPFKNSARFRQRVSSE